MIKKKILHLTKTYHPTSYGGIEKVVELITQSLSNKFFFEIVSLAPKEYKKEINGVKLSFFKEIYSVLSTPFCFKIFKYLKNKDYDVIHFHYPWPFTEIVAALILKEKKKIVTYHSHAISGIKIIDILFLPFSLFFLSLVDKIIVTSSDYAKSSLILKLFKKKIETIPIGIQIKKISYNEIKFDDFVLFLGAPRKYKGINIILKAAKKIKSRIIISGFFNKDYFTKYDLPENIKIISKPSEQEKENLLKNCTAVILPSTSRSEAFGISLLEAAQFFKPAITTNLKTGTTYIIKNGKNGFVIPKNNSKELSKKIEIILSNKNLAKKMGLENRKILLKKFNQIKMISKIRKLYNFI